MGMGDPEMDNEQIRNAVKERIENFSKGGLTPAQGADIILEGVRNEQWRILVGKDAEALDRAVRKHPLETYDLEFDKRVAENWER